MPYTHPSVVQWCADRMVERHDALRAVVTPGLAHLRVRILRVCPTPVVAPHIRWPYAHPRAAHGRAGAGAVLLRSHVKCLREVWQACAVKAIHYHAVPKLVTNFVLLVLLNDASGRY